MTEEKKIVADPQFYDGDERRRICIECISHREHSTKLEHLKHDLLETKSEMRQNITSFKTEMRDEGKTMWESIKTKVPYIHFISGLTVIITAIGIVTGINWTTMTRVLDSNHRVELQMTELKGEFKSVNKRLAQIEKQQEDFRKKFLIIRQELGIITRDHINARGSHK